MMETLTPYQKRRKQEEKMRHFFTQICNTGGLNQVLARHGLHMYSDGTIKDRGCVKKIFKHYLEHVVLPDIEKELGITGIKVHKSPSTLTQNLFEWYNAEIKQEKNNNNN